ncbi:MAG: hypothetical protein ABIJ58_01260 [Nanoarchaeota archaeon]
MMFIKKRGKKGSHVGVMLSFIIFVSFVVFVYVILRPAVVQDDKENFLEFIKEGVVRESSASLVTSSVNITEIGDCIQLNGFFGDNGISRNIILKDENGNALTANLNGAGGTHLRILMGGKRFFRIYESETFVEITSEGPCGQSDYTISGAKNDSYVFESKITALISKYNTNYSGLASDLGIPVANGFGFSFNNSEEAEISTNEAEILSTSIFAQDFSVQYVTESAGLEVGKIKVRAW